jgi:hypothetical protein
MLAASGLLTAWINDYKANPPPKKKSSLEDKPLTNVTSNQAIESTKSLSSAPTYPLSLSSGSIPNLRASLGISPSSTPTASPEKNVQKSPPPQHETLKKFEC